MSIDVLAVKLFAYGVGGSGFDSRSRRFDFRDWLSTASGRDMYEISLKRRKSSKQPTNQLFRYLNSKAESHRDDLCHPHQWYMKEFRTPAWQLWDAMIPILPRLHIHLLWLAQRDHVLSGVPLIPPPPTLTLCTNASCQGLGAFLEGKSVAEICSPFHQLDHVNLLEILAFLLALIHFMIDFR